MTTGEIEPAELWLGMNDFVRSLRWSFPGNRLCKRWLSGGGLGATPAGDCVEQDQQEKLGFGAVAI